MEHSTVTCSPPPFPHKSFPGTFFIWVPAGTSDSFDKKVCLVLTPNCKPLHLTLIRCISWKAHLIPESCTHKHQDPT
jgi:hypothetical protein